MADRTGRILRALAAIGAGLAMPASGNAAISDLAREIGAVDRQAIARLIEQHRTTTGHQIVVTTIPNASSIDLSDFAGGALGALGPEADTGIALVHDRASNTARIVAGAALRSRLDDDDLYQVRTLAMDPLLNAGDPGAALREGVTRLIALDVPPAAAVVQPDLPPLTQGQDRMRIAIIGLPLILMAYALWTLWIHARNRRSRRRAARAARAAVRPAVPAPAVVAPPPPVPPAASAAAAMPTRPPAAPLPGFGPVR